MGRVTPRQEAFDIWGYGRQEEDELTLAWAGTWAGETLKVIPAYKKKLCADTDAASERKGKKNVVAEGSEWLETNPNPAHCGQICETCACLPVQVPVCSKAIFSAAGEAGHGDRPKRADDVNVGSVKHYTFSRADLDNFPGETSLHLISAARAEQGGSERLVWQGSSSRHPCSKWALSTWMAPAAWPRDGQQGRFAEDINIHISQVSERKSSSRAVGLGKFFLWHQLIISLINSAVYCLQTVV